MKSLIFLFFFKNWIFESWKSSTRCLYMYNFLLFEENQSFQNIDQSFPFMHYIILKIINDFYTFRKLYQLLYLPGCQCFLQSFQIVPQASFVLAFDFHSTAVEIQYLQTSLESKFLSQNRWYHFLYEYSSMNYNVFFESKNILLRQTLQLFFNSNAVILSNLQ